MRNWVSLLLMALAAVGAVLGWIATRPGADLVAEFERRLASLAPSGSAEPVTEADLAHLPAPVATWLRRAGVVGRPRIAMVHTSFDATLWSAPGARGMSGPAEQVDVIDPPRRLFLMTTRMFGLPVAVLHDYTPETAGMQVRLARLVDVQDIGGPDFARIETVTFLNDLCLYAPSALIGPGFDWTAIDARSARVTYRVGPNRVSATLYFDEAGDLADFASEDRADISGGTPRALRWTTPVSDLREVGRRRVPGLGEAIWHRPEGPFTYGRFAVRDVRFTPAAP